MSRFQPQGLLGVSCTFHLFVVPHFFFVELCRVIVKIFPTRTVWTSSNSREWSADAIVSPSGSFTVVLSVTETVAEKLGNWKFLTCKYLVDF